MLICVVGFASMFKRYEYCWVAIASVRRDRAIAHASGLFWATHETHKLAYRRKSQRPPKAALQIICQSQMACCREVYERFVAEQESDIAAAVGGAHLDFWVRNHSGAVS
jgi:hypothetical protein